LKKISLGKDKSPRKERISMQRRKKKASPIALLTALFMLFGALALPASAQRISIKPDSITSTAVNAYQEIPIYLENGKPLAVKGRLVNSTTYVPLRAILSALMPSATLTYDAKTRTASVFGERLTLSASDRSNILYVNERCFYSDMPIRILDISNAYKNLNDDALHYRAIEAERKAKEAHQQALNKKKERIASRKEQIEKLLREQELDQQMYEAMEKEFSI
jgi:hypothetical protein